ncbi:nitroreductase [Amycolatopsis sp. NPDC004079]|uniref:Nitroreductase n=1 Tax=Amycolatopsis halotolerans TaxID=330083 RepID=A0ABV7QJ34_9PSEU
MDVYEAVRSRRSVRGFLDKPVPDEVLTRVLTTALRAPSGGNLQPWRVYVLSGAKLAELKYLVRERITDGDTGDPPQVLPYPETLPEQYARRIEELGALRYGAVGIAREDRAGRERVRVRNWDFFGAPVGLFCYLSEQMLPPQWLDAGMFLQTVMVLLRAEGLDSCAQIAWGRYHRSVTEIAEPPAGHVLGCGMSIGYADPDEPRPAIPRASLAEVVTFRS